MRVIAGEWRGRKLVAPKGHATRPTADRTRETLFSMLVSRLGSFEGLRMADLFAGSGTLGLEGLSRGAASCLFVEQDADAVKAIKTNIDTLGARGKASVQAGSVMALGPSSQSYDLILLDPPYETGAGQVALDRLRRLGWIGPQTWLSLELSAKDPVDLKSFEIDTTRKVGKAKLVLLRLADGDRSGSGSDQP